jgi:hypothetical protein
MKPKKNQFQENSYGYALPTEIIDEMQPVNKLIGSEVDKRSKKLSGSGSRSRKSAYDNSKDANALMSRQGKLLETLGRTIRRKSDKEATKISKENYREAETATAFNRNTKISTLQKRADAGKPTEVSGDALARAKRGDAPKLITTTNTWEKHKKDLGVGD